MSGNGPYHTPKGLTPHRFPEGRRLFSCHTAAFACAGNGLGFFMLNLACLNAIAPFSNLVFQAGAGGLLLPRYR